MKTNQVPNYQYNLKDAYEISGSLLINNKEFSDRSQLIYGSSSYGTDYSIYAKFKCEANVKDDSQVNVSLDFRLINYKGVINIGFDEGANYSFNKKDNKLNIKLITKGLELRNELTLNQVVTLPRNKFIKVEVERILKPLNDKAVAKTNIVEDCFKDGVFDDNYYYREGNFFYPRQDFDSMDMDKSLAHGNPKYMRPGKRCRVGLSIAYIF